MYTSWCTADCIIIKMYGMHWICYEPVSPDKARRIFYYCLWCHSLTRLLTSARRASRPAHITRHGGWPGHLYWHDSSARLPNRFFLRSHLNGEHWVCIPPKLWTMDLWPRLHGGHWICAPDLNDNVNANKIVGTSWVLHPSYFVSIISVYTLWCTAL